MLENPSDPPAPNSSAAPIKRYAPPNQRNRGLARRKSGDRSERTNNLYSNDGDRNFGPGFRSAGSADHSDAGSSSSAYESFTPRLIALNGCSRSEASQFLHERWKAAIHCYNDPTVDLSERPAWYNGSAAAAASPWGNFAHPHQLMSSPRMDFLVELQRAIHSSTANSKN